MHQAAYPDRRPRRWVAAAAISILLTVCVAASSGCFLVFPAAMIGATVLPVESVPQTVAEVGPMSDGEGIVFGSLSVGASDPSAADTETYTLHVVRLGRRGQRLGEHTWEADCAPGKTCPFVAKLDAGNYVADAVRIANVDDENYMLEFGYVLTKLDYRFSVDAGSTKYIGRLEMQPPVVDGAGELGLPIAIADAAAADAQAVGLATDDSFVVALIDGRWQSKPRQVFGFVR